MPFDMEDNVMVWTLKGLPQQRIELHTGSAAEAAAWAREKGGGVTVTGERARRCERPFSCSHFLRSFSQAFIKLAEGAAGEGDTL